MPLALILSSHVAASRVGGMAQSLALSQFSCDGMLVPTVLYGRHPGWGAPGGAAVPLQAFEGMLDGIEANGLFGLTDLVITGYFASVEQVRAAVRAIDAVRAAPRDAIAYTKAARIVVDPTIGDTGKGLYVPQDVADAIRDDLCPRADIICPNAWELEWLTGQDARDPQNAVRAAARLGRPVMISSINIGNEIGAVYADKHEAWLAAHPKVASAPNGTGDLLTALFAASLLEGQTASDALACAVGGVVETITAASAWASPELPIVAMGARIKQTSPSVRMERLA